jgi:16S rRNA (cytidine1402-2'-O)-methyltransferase
MSKTGKLILLPNFISPEQSATIFSEDVKQKIAILDGCVVESEKPARALLKNFTFEKVPSFRELPLYTLNEHSTSVTEMVDILKSGKNLGLVSDAGLPCIADPGSELVFQARRQGVKIEACGVHSSIILALMTSGLAQQSFYFVGYMPKEEADFASKIKLLEKLSKSEKTTIVFIETPYRNEMCLKLMTKHLMNTSFMAYCQDLSGPHEHIYMDKVESFKLEMAKIQKAPAVFVFRA